MNAAVDNSRYFNGEGLSEDERRLAEDKKEDLWKLQILHEIHVRELEVLAGCFIVKDGRHYDENVRKGWEDTCEYFLGQRLGRSPTLAERDEYFAGNHLRDKELLFYVISYPDKVGMKDDLAYERKQILEAFLETVEEIREG